MLDLIHWGIIPWTHMQPCRTCSKFVKWTKLVEAPLILMGYGASCNITFLSGVDPVVFMDQEQIAAVRRTQLLFFILMWLHVLVPVWGVGLRPLACRDCGFESRRGHGWMDGWMDVVSAVCCQVEFSATSWSLVQRSPTCCGASLCVI